MSEDPSVNMLQFARDLGRLEEHLEWARRAHGAGQYGDVAAEIATSFLTLLRGLTNGIEPVAAIAEASRVLDETRRQSRALWDAQIARAQEHRERVQAEEEITQKVECPHCGAASGAPCRTTGPARQVKTESHRGRFRLARSLNDGAADAAQEAAKRDAHARNVFNNAPDEDLRQWAAQELDGSALKAGQISQAEFERRWPGDQS
ncbi:zinc finger domain-containing protein [Streptomyces sp. NPDC002523]